MKKEPKQSGGAAAAKSKAGPDLITLLLIPPWELVRSDFPLWKNGFELIEIPSLQSTPILLPSGTFGKRRGLSAVL